MAMRPPSILRGYGPSPLPFDFFVLHFFVTSLMKCGKVDKKMGDRKMGMRRSDFGVLIDRCPISGEQ